MKKSYFLLVHCTVICLLLSFQSIQLHAQISTSENADKVSTDNSTSPFSWINILAYRQDKLVKISWTTSTEVNVKSFQIERSIDSNDWNIVLSNIPAQALPGISYYEQIDTSFSPKGLTYRIRQEDFDGSYTYSPTRIVSAVSATDKIIIYPVPVDNNFHLGNINPARVKNVQLINVNGNVIKSWNQFQAPYDIQEVPAGNYILRVKTSDDVQTLRLKKK